MNQGKLSMITNVSMITNEIYYTYKGQDKTTKKYVPRESIFLSVKCVYHNRG